MFLKKDDPDFEEEDFDQQEYDQYWNSYFGKD